MDEGFSLGDLGPHFTDPLAAADYLERLRWPDGPVCPHCGSDRKHYKLPNKTRRLWKCAACRKQFTVTVDTIFERSHIPLHKWLLAFHLLTSSKKGLSAHQLHRMLGITYKSAWFMAHRIRFALTQDPFVERLDGVVEVDETYVGGKVRRSNRKGFAPLDPRKPDPRKQTGRGAGKAPVVTLVERGGRARSLHVANVTGDELKGAIRRHVSRSAHLMTDSFGSYHGLGTEYASHQTVDHNREYVRGEVHTNTAEGFFSILKRGVNGVYHHVSEAHLHRYLAEFDFRYNTRTAVGVDDAQRARIALSQVAGKRLRYSDTRKT
jgi:transposase-like protein